MIKLRERELDNARGRVTAFVDGVLRPHRGRVAKFATRLQLCRIAHKPRSEVISSPANFSETREDRYAANIFLHLP